MRARTKSQVGKSSRRCGTAAERAAKAVLLLLTNRGGKPVFLSVERNLKSMAGLGGDDLIATNREGEHWSIEVKEWASVPLSFYRALVGHSFAYGPHGGQYLCVEHEAVGAFMDKKDFQRVTLSMVPARTTFPKSDSFLKVIRNADVLMFRRKDRTGWPWLFYFRGPVKPEIENGFAGGLRLDSGI